MKHVASSDCVAVDHGYDGLHERADSLVDIEHVEARCAVAVAVAAVGFVVLVATRTESLVAHTCEDYNAYLGGVAAVRKCFEYLRVCLRAEGVVHFRTVDAYFGYAFKKFKKNVGKFLDCFPLSCGSLLVAIHYCRF